MIPKAPFLKCLGRRLSRWRRSSALRQLKCSLAGFTLGLFLASVYGMTALYIQNHDLWFCIITTGVLAACAGFGTGLSDRVRTNVMLMFPMLCSSPVSNTMENVERAADSVICGAELAMNQTQQLLQRAANPLLPALSKIKQMARNAHSMAGRAQNFIRALTESVWHVARTLRNVLHFLANIGDVCNDNLGLPYQKCTRLFDEARENCMELLSVFSFLCHLLDGFQPLCGLARVGQLFCILPSYIADHIKNAFAFPTIAAFDQIKKEFEFNISTSINFDQLLNNSQSIQDAAQKIMKEVSEELGLLQELKLLLAYLGFFLLLFMYLQAVLYKNQYLHNDNFENIYITDQFIELDRKRSRQGKAAAESEVLFSDKKKRNNSASLYLTVRERRAIAGQVLSLLRYMVMTVILIAVDLMVFWVFELVHHQAQGEIVTQAPVVVAVNVNGSGYASDIFRDIAASFDILQKGNITVLSKKCLMKPLEPDYMRYLLIGTTTIPVQLDFCLLYGFTLFTVIAGGYVKRLQRFVCASLPGGAIIARLLDIGKKSCVACGKVLKTRGHDDEVHICPTPRCTGWFS
ncbi:hypothetical protein cypCar_00004482 [Cyprinus carpio]|nr:hypothetical protein cypCar_00004482 [Cyprinus carpio]